MIFIFFIFIVFANTQEMLLSDWRLISSTFSSSNNGVVISSNSFDARKWSAVTVPSTIVAGLVESGAYQEPFFAENFNTIDAKQFDVPWWYRCSFGPVTKIGQAQRTFLEFKGITYRANIFLNGQQIANQTEVVGTFRFFRFDVTNLLSSSTNNTIAVEVYLI